MPFSLTEKKGISEKVSSLKIDFHHSNSVAYGFELKNKATEGL